MKTNKINSKSDMQTLLALGFLLMLGQLTYAQYYFINFEGTGTATEVETVEVQNITQGTSLMMHGGDTLLLSGTVGINEHEAAEAMRIFPNPASGSVYVHLRLTKSAKTTLLLYDNQGQLAGSYEANTESGQYQYYIQGLSAGIYTLQLLSDEKQLSKKLISTGAQTGNLQIQLVQTELIRQPTVQTKTNRGIIEMQYNEGDQLLFECHADIYAVVIPLIATESTTITANFTPCTDGDGNHYPVVYIGTQVWMARNLATTKYRNGDDIPHVTTGSTWNNLSTGAYCWYSNNTAYGEVYGALYNWYATQPETNGNHALCPEGWRVPTDEDFTTLTNYLGGTVTAGGKLKETGFAHWQSPNTGATNEYGFTALPGGSRGWNANFLNVGTYGWLWTGSEQQGNFAWLRNMFHSAANMGRGTINKTHGLSIRCIQD